MVRVGQFFTIGAVAIGALFVAVIATTSSSFSQTSETAARSYFDAAVRSAPEAVDDALRRNDSVESIKQRLYSHHRMTEISAQRRGIEYRARHLVILPSQNTSVYVNYAPVNSTLNLSVSGLSQKVEVEADQSAVLSYGAGNTFTVEISSPVSPNVTEELNATQIHSVSQLSMSTQDGNVFRRTAVN